MANDAFLELVGKMSNLLNAPIYVDNVLLDKPKQSTEPLGESNIAEGLDDWDFYIANWNHVNHWLANNAPDYVLRCMQFSQTRTDKLYRAVMYYRFINKILVCLVFGLLLFLIVGCVLVSSY